MITLKFEISWLLNLVYIIYCGCRSIVAVEFSLHKLWQVQTTLFLHFYAYSTHCEK